MQKYDRQIKILAVLVITLVVLYFMYEMNGHKEAVSGYRHLLGFSVPNASASHYANMIREINRNEGVEEHINILVKEAQDNVSQQIKDIDDLIHHGIDLLVISPINDERVMEKLKTLRFPVIVLNEKKAMEFADAFIGFDNQSAGELLAKSISSEENLDGGIVLISGNKDEFISVTREEGFLNALSKESRSKVEKLYCGWKRNEAENQLKAFVVSGKQVKTVVALSDQMAYGAYLGMEKLREKDINFYGMNGFYGEDQGKDLLKRKIIKKTIQFENMYRAMITVSLQILHDEEFEKETILAAKLIE